MPTKYKAVKYPRVIVSNKRHQKLVRLAKAEKTTIESIAERMFRYCDSHIVH